MCVCVWKGLNVHEVKTPGIGWSFHAWTVSVIPTLDTPNATHEAQKQCGVCWVIRSKSVVILHLQNTHLDGIVYLLVTLNPDAFNFVVKMVGVCDSVCCHIAGCTRSLVTDWIDRLNSTINEVIFPMMWRWNYLTPPVSLRIYMQLQRKCYICTLHYLAECNSVSHVNVGIKTLLLEYITYYVITIMGK